MKQGKKKTSALIWLCGLSLVLYFLMSKILQPESIIDNTSSKAFESQVVKLETKSFNAGHFEHTKDHIWLKKPNPVVKLLRYIKDNPNKNIKMIFTTYYPKSYHKKRKFLRKVYFDKKRSTLTHTFLETNTSKVYENISIKQIKDESLKPDADFDFSK